MDDRDERKQDKSQEHRPLHHGLWKEKANKQTLNCNDFIGIICHKSTNKIIPYYIELWGKKINIVARLFTNKNLKVKTEKL